MPSQQLQEFIEQHELVNKDDKILLAVSGGKDSVLMATLFKQAGFRFSIAHCNFKLRGLESMRDAAFVEQLATKLAVPFHHTVFDTQTFAETEQLSTQMAARKLRYDWFEVLSTKYGYTKIAVAQHKNDSVETVLLNLTRGTGISGLHGILPKNGKYIRPLLYLDTEQVNKLLHDLKIEFVEDSSNLTTKYARNKIRKLVIPVLKELNPNLENTFVNNIERFRETEQVLYQVVEGIRNSICKKENEFTYINLDALKAIKPLQLLTFELLSPFSFSYSTVQTLLKNLENSSGTSFYSPSHRLTIDRRQLIISPIKKYKEVSLLWNENVETIDIFNGRLKLTVAERLPWQFDSTCAYFDYEDLQFPLIARNWEQGDQFKPFGMNNFKKVSDFFIDNKISVPLKEITPLVINGNSEILWIAGLRQDNRYKVKETTKKVAIFEWIINESS